MGRVVILVVLGLVVAWWLFSRIARLRDKDAPTAKSDRPTARTPAVQDMVACAQCGIHLPRNDAVGDGKLHYCGEPHRLMGPRD